MAASKGSVVPLVALPETALVTLTNTAALFQATQMDKTEIFKRFSDADRLYNEKKYTGALSIFLELAEHGDTGSMLNAASMYSSGQGTERNYDKALALENSGQSHQRNPPNGRQHKLRMGCCWPPHQENRRRRKHPPLHLGRRRAPHQRGTPAGSRARRNPRRSRTNHHLPI